MCTEGPKPRMACPAESLEPKHARRREGGRSLASVASVGMWSVRVGNDWRPPAKSEERGGATAATSAAI